MLDGNCVVDEFGEYKKDPRLAKVHTISKIVEMTNYGFYRECAAGTTTRTIEGVEVSEMIRLQGPVNGHGQTTPILGSSMTLDLPVESLLAYTNAVGPDAKYNLAFARFLVDIAGLAGALSVYVHHNEWWVKKSDVYGVQRAVPIIDVNKLFGFLLPKPNEDTPFKAVLSAELPFGLPGLSFPYAKVRMEPVPTPSDFPPVAPDFNFGSEHMASDRAYTLVFADQNDDDLWRVLYSPKRHQSVPGGGQQLDYRAFKRARLIGPLEEGQ